MTLRIAILAACASTLVLTATFAQAQSTIEGSIFASNGKPLDGANRKEGSAPKAKQAARKSGANLKEQPSAASDPILTDASGLVHTRGRVKSKSTGTGTAKLPAVGFEKTLLDGNASVGLRSQSGPKTTKRKSGVSVAAGDIDGDGRRKGKIGKTFPNNTDKTFPKNR